MNDMKIEIESKWVDVTAEEIRYWKPGITSLLTTEQVRNRLFRRVIRQKKWKLIKIKEEDSP